MLFAVTRRKKKEQEKGDRRKRVQSYLERRAPVKLGSGTILPGTVMNKEQQEEYYEEEDEAPETSQDRAFLDESEFDETYFDQRTIDPPKKIMSAKKRIDLSSAHPPESAFQHGPTPYQKALAKKKEEEGVALDGGKGFMDTIARLEKGVKEESERKRKRKGGPSPAPRTTTDRPDFRREYQEKMRAEGEASWAKRPMGAGELFTASQYRQDKKRSDERSLRGDARNLYEAGDDEGSDGEGGAAEGPRGFPAPPPAGTKRRMGAGELFAASQHRQDKKRSDEQSLRRDARNLYEAGDDEGSDGEGGAAEGVRGFPTPPPAEVKKKKKEEQAPKKTKTTPPAPQAPAAVEHKPTGSIDRAEMMKIKKHKEKEDPSQEWTVGTTQRAGPGFREWLAQRGEQKKIKESPATQMDTSADPTGPSHHLIPKTLKRPRATEPASSSEPTAPSPYIMAKPLKRAKPDPTPPTSSTPPAVRYSEEWVHQTRNEKRELGTPETSMGDMYNIRPPSLRAPKKKGGSTREETVRAEVAKKYPGLGGGKGFGAGATKGKTQEGLFSSKLTPVVPKFRGGKGLTSVLVDSGVKNKTNVSKAVNEGKDQPTTAGLKPYQGREGGDRSEVTEKERAVPPTAMSLEKQDGDNLSNRFAGTGESLGKGVKKRALPGGPNFEDATPVDSGQPTVPPPAQANPDPTGYVRPPSTGSLGPYEGGEAMSDDPEPAVSEDVDRKYDREDVEEEPPQEDTGERSEGEPTVSGGEVEVGEEEEEEEEGEEEGEEEEPPGEREEGR
ncbi:MAG: hypothetical protein DRP93_04995, partial [Candidatus Neomarinimicrobiota bacterium]